MINKLTIFFRKKREGVNSIESVFQALQQYSDNANNIKLPAEGATFTALWRNCCFAYRHSSQCNHITGDVHYIALATGRHTLLTIHDVGSALTGNGVHRLFVKIFWFWLPTLIVKHISVISQQTFDDVVKLCPWTKHKMSIIPNPINPKFKEALHHKPNQHPRILHIGTKPNKNLERVIDALNGINCELVIIGKLTESQSIRLRKTNINYQNRYDIPLDDLIEEYRECDIVSFPSSFEGFGMPIVEAQAMGRPVLAGDIPVLRDVAGPHGALFVSPLDTESIHNGFKTLINDIDLCTRLVSAGRENIKRFQPNYISQMYKKLYSLL